ncbi:hypothetical protein A3I25_01665 [Candidatus Nomurabacteria bacterium RIFCSPLOWO2_02_FULL_42_17]|uniref:50S ribosomal protein L35 n=2 Tax=Candidatus Nomuraibacteriota TaxID=1752729 RepID=A0A1F6WIL4_9BACT|nr:MAG: 50S ribosomal protein L35 [Parcubacteria group bacterium GW2011_GWA2_42_18]OGI81712.1 MAG: hypothetical protein A3B93_00890 [Candidatus Nomurabacteria bacterium RIFCSPHIGHO2_02_FULL_42_24]OGI97330.1 MAG: hypothetical protein A3I25_01665 [Candidatus Nomurabacteria bacterium RIFCSPLOWO2_02_FULL_42_17]
MIKTNKSFSKRLKITRTGKIMARRAGFNHFNAKQTRVKQLRGKRNVPLHFSNKTKALFLLN